jgi:hypothetical protein
MLLCACPRCHRHVSTAERACPFCAHALERIAPRHAVPSGPGRAGVFASIVLAAPACWSSAADRQPEQSSTWHAPPANGAGSGSADPGPVDPHPGVDGVGSVSGTVTDAHGAPASDVVWLRGAGIQRSVVTDDRGRYVFDKVPPGKYEVALAQRHPRRQPPSYVVEVRVGETAEAHLVMPVYPRTDVKMPYGAPPAPARIV